MRTRTLIGAAAGLVVAAALVAVAAPVVADSDALTTDIRVAADNPLAPEPAPLPAGVRALWTAPTGTAGTAVEGPTAVATGADRVAGLDPATGRERWSYRRGNARLCDATLRDGVVVALFARSSGCRDLIGLDAATGARRWTRTLEFTTDARLTSGPGVGVATAGGQMIAFDTGGGLNRWTWSAAGCTLDPAVVGQIAVATVARCGAENRLVVHLPYAETEPWVGVQPAGTDLRVLTSDATLATLGTAGLVSYGTKQDTDGKIVVTPSGTTTDPRLVAGDAVPTAVAEGEFLVVWTGTAAVGVDTRRRTVLWSAPATGPPTLADGQVLLAAGDGFTSRPSSTGTPVTTIPAGTPVAPGATLSRVGRLVVAATRDRVTAYG